MFVLHFIRDLLATAGKFVMALIVLLLISVFTIAILVLQLVLNLPQ